MNKGIGEEETAYIRKLNSVVLRKGHLDPLASYVRKQMPTSQKHMHSFLAQVSYTQLNWSDSDVGMLFRGNSRVIFMRKYMVSG